MNKYENIRNRDKVLNNMVYLELINTKEAYKLATLNDEDFIEQTTKILKTSSNEWALRSLEILKRLVF